MTVIELIRLLAQYPAATRVRIESSSGEYSPSDPTQVWLEDKPAIHADGSSLGIRTTPVVIISSD